MGPQLTDELRLYSSNSLESSSMSVYASLICETGRSSDVLAEMAPAKSGCDFPRSNISTPGSSGVMGVMACWGTVSEGIEGSPQTALTMITELGTCGLTADAGNRVQHGTPSEAA